ncbi:GDSL-type esterase/lipase family protein [Streptococcus sp. FSL R7-0212]|uniref:cytidylyltransferase domain-containing protein n=1 Tax=Streptococcus sp. FSL R7-0212 TaxID=2921726 RepID=UPI0030F53928
MNPICIIPARSGSKGLPNKNMLFLDEMPLIYHTIDAAINSEMFKKEDIFVSTDSQLYAEICLQKGISVKMRSPELSSDTSTTADMLNDFLKDFHENQVFALLQVTSPLRNHQHLKEALQLFESSEESENVVSFTKADKHPSLLSTLTKDGFAEEIAGVDKGYRRQNKKDYFYPNGAIFISSKKSYIKNQSFFTNRTKAYLMEHQFSYDIDYLEDFKAVLGQIYFDYTRREIENQKKYISFFKKKIENMRYHKLIIGDSRMIDIELDAYDNFSFGNVSLNSINRQIKLIQGYGVKEVLISAGINDISASYSISKIIQNLEEILNFLELENINITLTTIPYSLFRPEIDNARVKCVNDRIKEYSSHKSIKVIDLNFVLSKDDNLEFNVTNDGIHYNDIGKEIVQNTIKQYI